LLAKKEKKMVNKKNLLGILAVLLTFGLVLAGCDNGTTSNNGNASMKVVNNCSEPITEMKIFKGDDYDSGHIWKRDNLSIAVGATQTLTGIPVGTELMVKIDVYECYNVTFESGKITTITWNADHSVTAGSPE
jgi:hypothetical protein